MKASELLQLYQEGERNFAGANLRGQSFEGKDLSGADFTGADIRGTNFSHTTLISANFSRAEAGLQRRGAVVLLLLVWLFAAVSGFFAAFNGYFVSLTFNTGDPASFVAGWVALITQLAFLAIFLCRGVTVAIAVTVIGAVAGAVAIAVAFVGAVAVAFAVAGAVVVVGAFVGAVAVAVAGAGAVVGAVAVAVAVGGAGAGAVAGIGAGAVAGAVAAANILISSYIGWRALAGDPKYLQIRSVAISVAAWGGTSFRGADLTHANFNQAHLKSVDLRKAKLVRTSWLHTRRLDRVRPGDSFLDNAQVRSLVQTGQGQGLEFIHQNLRGINLATADLENANFRAADLSEATLAGADLTSASLVQTQLDKTDLTGCTLTGATIEGWGITGNTNLQGVRCEYIFMRWVKPGASNPNPRRKPDNYEENFADKEFGYFIKPIVDTLDLYHNQNVNSRAIAIAFKQLAETHPEAELEIAAMEKRGQDKFLLKARTAQQANHSELSQEYFEAYNQARALTHKDAQQLLAAEKDARIRDLKNCFDMALKRPSFYAENYQQHGDLMAENSGPNINAGNNIGDVTGVASGDISGVINLGNIQGDINNAIQQLPERSDATQPDLKDLLSQLQTAIVNESELDEAEKAATLDQVKKLAEAGQAPEAGSMKKLANKATQIFKGTAAGLTEGAKLATVWEAVGPVIMTFFGLL
ncbi:hypothetical protein C1752_03988 [Acaryochloris thomasi RCC1774]|uniref:Pentapeptide repeat-containing protein n=1 Tax=Acaryochloris thomasi RCC1774 TaxID=1764569 RepID=A0A2W1JPC7_9CYAN|nr:pentapeptide repeat-containing protein [Acaryochloris thomasi]PZD72014.1 hypothetical protein C1752_03988 [Acaryochloris thomasi RCC1774]